MRQSPRRIGAHPIGQTLAFCHTRVAESCDGDCKKMSPVICQRKNSLRELVDAKGMLAEIALTTRVRTSSRFEG